MTQLVLPLFDEPVSNFYDSPVYNIWRNIKQRCYNPNTHNFHCYGGRGITMCEEWKNDFWAFHAWAMSSGYAPNLTLDRIDNDGPYSPVNNRWTTKSVQSRNTSRNVWLEIWGERKCVMDWASDPRCTVVHSTIKRRLQRGWEPERAVSSPPKK